MSKRQSQRQFRRGAKNVQSINIRPQRGGIKL